MLSFVRLVLSAFALLFVALVPACAQDETSDPPAIEAPKLDETEDLSAKTEEDADGSTLMTGADLLDLVRTLDPEAETTERSAVFTLLDRELLLVFDESAGRMRVVSPILPADLLDRDILLRIAQANYDAVLDARYAVANDLLWAVFLRPLPSLTRDDFLSGLAHTITAAETFGTTYSSGAMVFGGGDSNSIHEDLIKQLEDLADGRTPI